MRYLKLSLLALFLSVAVPAAAAPDAAPTAAAPDAAAAKIVAGTPKVVVEGPAAAKVEAPAKAEVAAAAAAAAAPAAAVPADLDVPVTNEEAGEILALLLDAGQNGHWTALAGLLILLLVWVFNKLGLQDKIGPKATPWVALGTGVVVAIAISLAQGGELTDALKVGLLDGAVAVALWELIAKHLLTKKAEPESNDFAGADSTPAS